MGEEYLAQQGSNLNWFMVTVVFLIVLLAINYFATRNLSEKRRTVIKNKFLWVSVCVLIGYFFMTIPYAGFFYNFGSKKDVPKDLDTNEQVVGYIKDHDDRIRVLERELEETREDLRLLNDHYRNLIYLIMIAVFSYGAGQIFGSQKHKNLREIESEQLSKL